MKVAVAQVVASLATGGLERIAVNIANAQPRDRFVSHMCTTRSDGVMADTLVPDVGRVCLERKRTTDVRALRTFAKYITDHDIRILHVHGTAVFLGALAALVRPSVKILWHDHYGEYATKERPRWLYWSLARRLDGVIAVNQPLVEWATRKLHISPDRVWYVPNFVCETKVEGPAVGLPGIAGSRIVNVANFRPQKDHPNLLRALRIVLRHVPDAHLLLLGVTNDRVYHEEVMREANQGELRGHVTHLGERPDIPAILKGCDVGVLASRSEGLPVSLIEYGVAGLASVCTEIGQCAEVLDHGKAGLLVPTRDPERLAEALVTLLESPEKRAELGRRLRKRTDDVYSTGAVIGQITAIYDQIRGRA